MTTTLFARQTLTTTGWRNNVCITVDIEGKISSISDAVDMPDNAYGVLLPAISNLHSHSSQRAMAGLAETRGSSSFDDFWSWRKVMYRFLELLSPEDVESIAAQVQMEMLESGYAAVAEFHYLHHALDGAHYDQLHEMSERLFQAALTTGIGYTHLPVLYSRGGLDDSALNAGQLRFGCTVDQFNDLHTALGDRMGSLPKDFVLGVAPHSLRAVTNEGLWQATRLCPASPIHIHIAEQENEVRAVSEQLGARPIRWLFDNMPVDDRWCLVHATHAEKDEINSMVNTRVVAGLCPITEANLGDGIFDGAAYMSQGGVFGVGSDSNVRIALSEELRMLEVSQRLRDQKRVILTNKSVPSNGRFLYQQSALGGAQALGRNAGEIRIGALADLVALDDQHPTLISLTGDALLDTWIFASSDDIVSDVWAAGRHVVKFGAHVQQAEISNRFKRTISKLRQAL